MKQKNQLIRRNPSRSGTTMRLSVGGAAFAAGISLMSGAAFADDTTRFEKMEKENQALKERLMKLETAMEKEGLKGGPVTNAVKALSDIKLTGFVAASYFYDNSDPGGGKTSPGYLWNRKADSFSINKVKLTLASSPVERSGDKFDAAYRASLIFGQDAPIVNSGSGTTGFENLREAYVEMNVPVGTGLNVKVGELISLLNYESGDGGAANDNFSQGYQWFYTGNGPAAGAQLGYTLTDWLDVKVRVQNGMYAGPVDNNGGKTVMAALGIKPNEKSWISLIGFTGREENAGAKIFQGVSMLGGYKLTDAFSVGTELDYFTFTSATGNSAPVWSTGGWFSYALAEKWTAAVRAEFLSDAEGVDASGDPLGFAPNTGNDISSIAFTLNYKPLPSIKIQPEIRFDHTSVPKGFGKEEDRVIIGAGATYLF